MYGRRLFQRLTLRSFLSYGPQAEGLDLEPLNVLIGPNASGKSNVIEAVSLLQAAPRDLLEPIRQGGGVTEWLWKGGDGTQAAELDAVVHNPHGQQPLRHRLAFTAVNQRFQLVDEAIENEHAYAGYDTPYYYYRYQNGSPVLRARLMDGGEVGPEEDEARRPQRRVRRDELSPEQSVLSQRRDPDQYPEITYLAEQYAAIRIFGEWNLGRRTEPRKPQAPDLPEDFLEESARNLVLVINDLQHRPETRQLLNDYLRRFYPRAEDITTKVHGGTVQVYLHEKGLREPIPATRLSDGTLRYLCLLSVLCHPSPPPLVCIEEPELGLHPDILPTIAELLQDACQRTQVILTTHSEQLVAALSKVPEAIVVAERDDSGTVLRRLDPERLKDWLERYTLGDLWAMGELGGNP